MSAPFVCLVRPEVENSDVVKILCRNYGLKLKVVGSLNADIVRNVDFGCLLDHEKQTVPN